MRHLSRTDVFNDVRLKFQHKIQIYRFHKQINSSRLVRVVPVIKVLPAPFGFPGNKKNKVENIVKHKARKKLYQIQLAVLVIIFVQYTIYIYIYIYIDIYVYRYICIFKKLMYEIFLLQ